MSPGVASGVGLDVVEVARMGRILRRRPEFFVRYCSPAERAAAVATRSPAAAYAACFAAKEALLKACGRGIWDGVPLREIEHLPGRRALRLGPRARQVLGASPHHLSVSVVTGVAWALVVVGGDTPGARGPASVAGSAP